MKKKKKKKNCENIDKKKDLLEGIKMLKMFYTLLNFKFVMIYIIHNVLVLHKNHLNYVKHNALKCFLKEYNRLLHFLNKIN